MHTSLCPSAVQFGYHKYSINRKENKHCRFCHSFTEKLGTSSIFYSSP